MTTIMTQSEWQAAAVRIRSALGIGRMGTEPDAPPLPSPLMTGNIAAGAALLVESEIHGAQLNEYEVWARAGLGLRARSFHVGLYGGYSGLHAAALIADDVFEQHVAAVRRVEAGT